MKLKINFQICLTARGGHNKFSQLHCRDLECLQQPTDQQPTDPLLATHLVNLQVALSLMCHYYLFGIINILAMTVCG